MILKLCTRDERGNFLRWVNNPSTALQRGEVLSTAYDYADDEGITFFSTVADVTVEKVGTGIAEIKHAPDDEIYIQWISFSPCFITAYPETIYTEMSSYPRSKSKISNIRLMEDGKIDFLRKSFRLADQPIFARYKFISA